MAASTKVIRDLVPDVVDALQGRTDVSALAPKYIKKAVQEITESYPFEELRVTGPEYTLTANLADYDVDLFLNSGDAYTSPESFVIYINPPYNTIKNVVKYRTPQAIEQMTSAVTVGIPAYFTRYGKQFRFGPVPVSNYTVFLRYQVEHPFPLDDSGLIGATLYIPRSWEEIVVYAAAMRVAHVKGLTERRQELHDLLYGDPEYVMSEGKKGRPGLIAARIFQVERDQKFSTRQLMPIVARYNAR